MKKLSAKQFDAIKLMLDPEYSGLRSAEIAVKVGVSERTLYRWQNENSFRAAYSRHFYEDNLYQRSLLIRELYEEGLNGDTGAIKQFMKVFAKTDLSDFKNSGGFSLDWVDLKIVDSSKKDPMEGIPKSEKEAEKMRAVEREREILEGLINDDRILEHDRLDQKQLDAICMMTHPAHRKMRLKDIAKSLDIDPRTLYTWRHDGVFVTEFGVQMRMQMIFMAQDLMRHLFNLTRNGDDSILRLKAIGMFFTYSAILDKHRPEPSISSKRIMFSAHQGKDLDAADLLGNVEYTQHGTGEKLIPLRDETGARIGFHFPGPPQAFETPHHYDEEF